MLFILLFSSTINLINDINLLADVTFVFLAQSTYIFLNVNQQWKLFIDLKKNNNYFRRLSGITSLIAIQVEKLLKMPSKYISFVLGVCFDIEISLCGNSVNDWYERLKINISLSLVANNNNLFSSTFVYAD